MPLLSTVSEVLLTGHFNAQFIKWCNIKTWLNLVQPRITRPWDLPLLRQPTLHPPRKDGTCNFSDLGGQPSPFCVRLCVCFVLFYSWEWARITIVNGDAKFVDSVLGRGRYKSQCSHRQQSLSGLTATGSLWFLLPANWILAGESPALRGWGRPRLPRASRDRWDCVSAA